MSSSCISGTVPTPMRASWLHETQGHMEEPAAASDLQVYGHTVTEMPPGAHRLQGMPTDAEQKATAEAMAKLQAKHVVKGVQVLKEKLGIVKKKPAAKEVKVVHPVKVDKALLQQGAAAARRLLQRENTGSVEQEKTGSKDVEEGKEVEEGMESEEGKEDDNKEAEDSEEKDENKKPRGAKRKADVKTFANRFPPKTAPKAEVFEQKRLSYFQVLDKHQKMLPTARQCDYWRFVQSALVENPADPIPEIAERWILSLDVEV